MNPLRYRGYYFDSDTGLYYLQSRYYDSNTGRFINADDSNILLYDVYNLFCYCHNNPIMSVDPNGYYDISKFNCYAYAMGISNKWMHPGKGKVNVLNKNGFLKDRKFLMLNYYSVQQLRKWVLKDFGNKARVLKNKDSKLNKGEYRVAMRVAVYTRPLPIGVGGPIVWSTYDFHFWKQDPKTGVWWHKPGKNDIDKKGKVNPDKTKNWIYGIEAFYQSMYAFNGTVFSLAKNKYGRYVWYRQLYYNSQTLYIAYKGDFWKR